MLSDKSAKLTALCECQALHQILRMMIQMIVMEQNRIWKPRTSPSFYTYEEGLSHLTAEGQAALTRSERMLSQSVRSLCNMAGVWTRFSKGL